MTVADTKKWLVNQLKESYHSMKVFEGDNNPQVKELYIRAEAEYNILDELYYKLTHRYFKSEEE